MKNNKKILTYGLLFLGIFAFQEILSVCKTFVYADESLSTFQQDIVSAKQKYQAISGKMNSVNVLLAQEDAKISQTSPDQNSPINAPILEVVKPFSAQNFQAESQTDLVKDSKINQPAKTFISDKPIKDVKVEKLGNNRWFWERDSDKKKQPTPSNLSPFNLEKIEVKEKPKPTNKWFWDSSSGQKENQISDGEALYKVAISDNKITLEEAVDIGLSNNVQLLALKKKVDVAEAKLVEAKRALLPVAQVVYEKGGGKQPTGLDPPESRYRGFRNENYKLNVSQPLYYGGELFLTIKQADSNIRATKEEYEKARNELIHQIRTNYYGALKAEYNVEYQTDLLKEMDAIYQRAKKENEQKVIAEVDFLLIQSRYQQVRFQYESSASDVLSTELLLQQTIRVREDHKIPLDLELKFKKINPNIDEVVAVALKNNPDIRNKKFAYESAKLGLDVFQAKKRPHFDLKGSWGKLGEMKWDDLGHGDKLAADDPTGFNVQNQGFEMKKEWYLMLKGSVPIGPNSLEYQKVKHVYAPSLFSPTEGSEDWSDQFTYNVLDKLSDITDEKQAQAALLQAQTDLEKAQDDAASKIRDSFYALRKSLLQIDSSVSKIKYQEKQNGIYKYMMSLQEAPLTNLLDGLVEQAQNKFGFIGAVVEYQLAVSNLNIAIGDPNYFKS